MSTHPSLAPLLAQQPLNSSEVFTAIQTAGAHLSDSNRESELALEIAIRLLDARRAGHLPGGADEAVDLLAEECGLYPYIKRSSFGLLTQALIEAHGVNLRERVYLHSKQMEVLLWLLERQNVILSAPTSFGKTLLVDAFLAKANPETVVMIVPTVALLDECRRRLVSNFGQHYSVITTVTEPYDSDRPTVFVLTQERFLRRRDIETIDFLFVDEFYKLDPERDDGRYETLNLALYRALPRARQCFMAGPHIRNIQLGERWRGTFRFVQTDYKTVTVNVLDRTNSNREKAFLDDLRSIGDESSLVFTATPATASQLMQAVIDAGIRYSSDHGPALGQWIADNYHADWSIARGTSKGIAVHHGRLPRSLAQLFVQLFDARSVKLLICTSTLIEGVNTSAANVFVYDKKINRTDFDFFSFTNIRGRVGRMMRHFVGNAFLYHEPPNSVQTSVEIPILSSPDSTSDYLLMNVDREQLSPAGRNRQESLPLETGLSADLLREHGSLGTDLLVMLVARVKDALSGNSAALMWRGFPDKEQRVVIAELALVVAHQRGERTGIHTPRQVAWAWSQLKTVKKFPSFLRWFVSTFGPQKTQETLDAAFQFLQACEFSFPRTIGAIESIVNEVEGVDTVDYSAYAFALENWFRPAWMKQLDEMGVPIPLAERLASNMSPDDTGRTALTRLRDAFWESDPSLDSIDRFILRSALVTS
jgi:hypothetical protein